MKKRGSGILMPVFSLPGEDGIGTFGKEAYEFIDFLVKSEQKYWQILPLGVTSFGDSPYQCISAFAGNPYFIDLNRLVKIGFLNENDLKEYKFFKKNDLVDYGFLYKNKMKILEKAYKRAKIIIKNDLDIFYDENKSWLREFSIFMALKANYGGLSWLEWEEAYKDVNSLEIKEFEKKNQDEIYFWVFIQYFFFKQWEKLKSYANKNGIRIIGDLPMYVSEDSSDLWANPSLFQLDHNYCPITVAGCPPDDFAPKGQLWGNPIYDWQTMEKEGYKWWIKRFEHSFKLYDTLRIDHFRGFEAYWEIELDSKDAVNGKWTKGPGIKLFRKVKEELGELDIIAEDLGFITENVKELIEETGFPGMKVLQFAFKKDENSEHAIHNHEKNSVVYTGTHDSSTVIGWSKDISKEELEYVKKYLNLCQGEDLNWALIRGAWSSTSYLAIAPIQDFLGLDDNARINRPSIIGENWTWRLKENNLTDELANKIREITRRYKR